MESTSKFMLTPLIAGGIAGLTVDVTLYPIDTFKTRLQSKAGFFASGGFSGVYRGLGAVMIGSVPSAALFFLSYETIKALPPDSFNETYKPIIHMLAASVGEVVACIVRVPMEIAKQRKQALPGPYGNRSPLQILVEAYRTEGFRRGLYRGFFSTVIRDLPFSFIQFPLWEYLKTLAAANNANNIPTSMQSAICGSIAGAFAGGVTTPLDVAKTRIMLAPPASKQLGVLAMLYTVFGERGFSGLFAGFFPRITSFALGGAIFLGAYDYASVLCNQLFNTQQGLSS